MFYVFPIVRNEENALARRCPQVILFIDNYILQYETTAVFINFIESFSEVLGYRDETVEIFGILE